jgi:hypothetical protein
MYAKKTSANIDKKTYIIKSLLQLFVFFATKIVFFIDFRLLEAVSAYKKDNYLVINPQAYW